MCKQSLNIYFAISGWLYLAVFTESEPLCYTRKVLDDHTALIDLANCSGHGICKRFASRQDVTLTDLLNSSCYKPDENASSAVEKWSEQNICTEIWCSVNDLPHVPKGSFECPSTHSYVKMGETCILICEKDLHPASTDKTVCQKGIYNPSERWSDGNFTCHGCNVWNKWGGIEYKVSSSLQSWEESRDLCVNESAHLVTINDKEENIFLQKMLSYCSTWTYTGLNRIATGVWEWTDGTEVTYTNWGPSHPGGWAEQCAYMSGSDGSWADFYCNHPRKAVCERKTPVL